VTNVKPVNFDTGEEVCRMAITTVVGFCRRCVSSLSSPWQNPGDLAMIAPQGSI